VSAYIGALGLYLALAGLYFDIAYHHVYPFEAFWSNPHIVMYSGLGIAFLTGSILVLHPSLRRGFGGKSIYVLGMEISPYTLFYSVSCIVALLAGYLDSIWHGIYGSFESAYSFPHTLALTGSYTASLILIHVLMTKYGAGTYIGSFLLAGVAMALFRTFIGPFSNSLDLFRELASGEGMGEHFIGKSTLLWNRYIDKGVYVENPIYPSLLASYVYLSILYLSKMYLGDRRAYLYTGGFTTLLISIFYLSTDMAGYNPVYRSPLSISIAILSIILYMWDGPRGYILAGAIPGIIYIAVYGLSPLPIASSLAGAAMGYSYGYMMYRGLSMDSRLWLVGTLSVNFILVPAILGYVDLYIRFM